MMVVMSGVAQSSPDVSSETDSDAKERFHREATIAGFATLVLAVVSACIGFLIYLVIPAYESYTRSVEGASVAVFGGVLIVLYGAFWVRYALGHIYKCIVGED